MLKVFEYNIYLVDMNQNNIIIFDYKNYSYQFFRQDVLNVLKDFELSEFEL